MKITRPLTNKEHAIVSAMIDAGNPEWHSLKNDLNKVVVSEMDDGGMGSILFETADTVDRRYGDRVSEAECFDADGVLVSIVLNVDSDRRLYELDIWKVDFSRLITLPDVSELRFIKNKMPP